MNVEYLNPIITAATYVLRETCNLEISVGRPYLTHTVYDSKIFIVMIGITGQLQGQVILAMGEEVACEIARQMMMGIPVTELNDMARSALGELMNMTMGNAMTGFYNKGIKLDITPPTMFVSTSLNLSVGDSKMICIPISFGEKMLIELHVAIKDK